MILACLSKVQWTRSRTHWKWQAPVNANISGRWAGRRVNDSDTGISNGLVDPDIAWWGKEWQVPLPASLGDDSITCVLGLQYYYFCWWGIFEGIIISVGFVCLGCGFFVVCCLFFFLHSMLDVQWLFLSLKTGELSCGRISHRVPPSQVTSWSTSLFNAARSVLLIFGYLRFPQGTTELYIPLFTEGIYQCFCTATQQAEVLKNNVHAAFILAYE